MPELLSDVDWTGKVYSGGWTSPRGGVLESVEPATGAVLATVGLANADDIAAAAAAARSRRSRSGPPSPARSAPR